jgi:hypothetical protein
MRSPSRILSSKHLRLFFGMKKRDLLLIVLSIDFILRRFAPFFSGGKRLGCLVMKVIAFLKGLPPISAVTSLKMPFF